MNANGSQDNAAREKEEKWGISGSTLKLIAIVTMLTDHVGAALVLRLILKNAAANGWVGVIPHDTLYVSYMVMRFIGRIAFPIFCFLLVEGSEKTRSVRKYALRLGIFALISEIPFDLAFSSEVLEFSYQNVFFTLFIGLLTMMAWKTIMKQDWNRVLKSLLAVLSFVAGAVLAELLHTDYGAIGVACIMVLYLSRGHKVKQIIAGCIAFLWEGTAPLAFVPIGFYNGKRGLKLKYIFYIFYPAHLLLIYLICVWLGIAGYVPV